MPGRARNDIQLQATLACSSAMPPPPEGFPVPHHPITCGGRLSFNEDNSFACDHTTVGPDDARTNYCLDHSIAMLVIELALDREFPL